MGNKSQQLCNGIISGVPMNEKNISKVLLLVFFGPLSFVCADQIKDRGQTPAIKEMLISISKKMYSSGDDRLAYTEWVEATDSRRPISYYKFAMKGVNPKNGKACTATLKIVHDDFYKKSQYVIEVAEKDQTSTRAFCPWTAGEYLENTTCLSKESRPLLYANTSDDANIQINESGSFSFLSSEIKPYFLGPREIGSVKIDDKEILFKVVFKTINFSPTSSPVSNIDYYRNNDELACRIQ